MSRTDVVQAAAFRRVCGAFPTGVAVVTVETPAGEVHGMTANSFLSVSLEPLLMLVSIDRRAIMCRALEHASTFAISILAAGQREISNHFAGRPSRLAGTPLSRVGGRPGASVIDGAAAWLLLEKQDAVDAGDHRLFFGTPTDLHCTFQPPLVFHAGRYHQLPDGFDAHLLAFM